MSDTGSVDNCKENHSSYPTINSMQKEYAEQLRAVHELIEEYRTSNDYTMARAHITLFKIDEIITSFDSSPTTETSINNGGERT